MWNTLLDLIFPRRSIAGNAGAWITEEERRRLRVSPIIEDQSTLRRRGIYSVDRIVAAHAYHESDLLQKAIRLFKYKRIPGFAEELASLIAQSVPLHVLEEGHGTICPVPLHWTRKFQRGFNQAALLSTSVAYTFHMQHAQLLRRKRATGHQAWRNREERLVALKDAFVFSGGQCPHRIILIDDLSTTGATLEECAFVLKKSGAKWVEGWVVAHG